MPPQLTVFNVNQSFLNTLEQQLSSPVAGTGFKTTKLMTPLARSRIHTTKRVSIVDLNLRPQIAYRNFRNQEPELLPVTASAGNCLARMLFRRRKRMADAKLVILWFDGVVGEMTGTAEKVRVRRGAIQSLRKISEKAQLAIVLPCSKRHASLFTQYLSRHQGCPLDAIYHIRSEFSADNGTMFVDYSQIL